MNAWSLEAARIVHLDQIKIFCSSNASQSLKSVFRTDQNRFFRLGCRALDNGRKFLYFSISSLVKAFSTLKGLLQIFQTQLFRLFSLSPSAVLSRSVTVRTSLFMKLKDLESQFSPELISTFCVSIFGWTKKDRDATQTITLRNMIVSRILAIAELNYEILILLVC
jgi:hypothetical protein